MLSVHATAYPVRLAYTQIVQEPRKALHRHANMHACMHIQASVSAYSGYGACLLYGAVERACRMDDKDYNGWSWHLMYMRGFEC